MDKECFYLINYIKRERRKTRKYFRLQSSSASTCPRSTTATYIYRTRHDEKLDQDFPLKGFTARRLGLGHYAIKV